MLYPEIIRRLAKMHKRPSGFWTKSLTSSTGIFLFQLYAGGVIAPFFHPEILLGVRDRFQRMPGMHWSWESKVCLSQLKTYQTLGYGVGICTAMSTADC